MGYSIFIGGGIFGAFFHVVRLLLRIHWLTLASPADIRLEMFVSNIDMVLLGLIFALIISGQLRGKRKSVIMGHEPAV